MKNQGQKMRGGVIGYGGTCNMGKVHGDMMIRNGIEFAAVCDVNHERLEQAQSDYPGVSTYHSVADMLEKEELDLVTIITPHDSHAPLALQVLESGRHCIVEKPMAITLEQAKAMEAKAKETGLMLSVFHNRRWDGWYLEAQKLIAEGKLGDVYRVELFWGDYISPASWGEWRADKEKSGGTLFDWGAHMTDWLLGLVPGKMKSIRGSKQNRVWNDFTIDDQMCYSLYFENGAVGHVEISYISCQKKPLIRIFGTKGALTHQSDNENILCATIMENDQKTEYTVNCESSGFRYYENIAGHLMRGEKLLVTPEQTKRVIAVIDSAGKSAETGMELSVPNE